MKSMSAVLDSEADLGPRRLVANGALGWRPRSIPPFMGDLVGMPTGVYLSVTAAEELKNTKGLLHMGTALFYLLVALVPATAMIVLGRAVPARLAAVMAVSKFLALVLLVAALICAFRNLELGFKEALVISTSVVEPSQ